MILDFLKTTRSKDELKAALEVIREFKGGESIEEWVSAPFVEWSMLERLEELLDYLVEGKPLTEKTVDEIAYLISHPRQDRSRSHGGISEL